MQRYDELNCIIDLRFLLNRITERKRVRRNRSQINIHLLTTT